MVFSILFRILVAPSVLTHFYFLGKKKSLISDEEDMQWDLFVCWLLACGWMMTVV